MRTDCGNAVAKLAVACAVESSERGMKHTAVASDASLSIRVAPRCLHQAVLCANELDESGKRASGMREALM